MSIGAGGSSMSGSSSVATDMVFDMGSEQAVLALLRRIHLSLLPPDTKNDLRDLVFSTRFGTVKPVDEAMITTFATHGFNIAANSPITPVSIGELEAPLETLTPLTDRPTVPVSSPTTLGRGRQTPHFAPVQTILAAPSVVEEPLIPKPVPPVAPLTPVSAVATIEVPPPVVVADEPPLVAPAAPTLSGEQVVSVTEERAVTPVAPLAPEVVTSTATVNPSDRIAAIKREVNALVGNPVNLIDVNNDVGREYMNALLDAMKKSLGGTTAQEVERAMARLERSFVAVQEAVRGAATLQPTASSQTPEAIRPQNAEVSPQSFTAVTNEVVSTSSSPVTEVEAPTSVVELVDVPPPVAVPVIPVVDQEEAPQSVAIVSSKRIPVVSAEAPAEQSSEVITSVAKERQLKELMEARQAAEAADAAKRAAMAANNPLMADDVTSGLHQLLSEWKLFKSSGIFGTGPSGNEHPLYKKLNQLTMAAVLAGRFEGANADIKRSITDYMNGWRYEEGVTHEVSETFEHYLRRVIRTILDKQTQTVDAR